MDKIFNNYINKDNSYLIFDNNFFDENKQIIINEVEKNLKINDNIISNYKEIFNNNNENNNKFEEILSKILLNQDDMNIIYLKKEKNEKNYQYINLFINEKILNEKNINNIQFSFIEIDLESAKIFKNVIKKSITNLNHFKIPERKLENKSLDYFEFKLNFNNSENISSFKYYIIYKNYDKILYFLSDKKKENDIKILIEKINIFTEFQDEYLKTINLFPSIQNQILMNIEEYKIECMEYYNNIIKQIEDFKNNLKNEDIKKYYEDFLLKQNEFLNKYENIKTKEIESYKDLLQYYISKEDNIINSNLNYESLKDLISQFNITNQEIKNICNKYNLKYNFINIDKEKSINEKKNNLNIGNNIIENKQLTITNKKNSKKIIKGRSNSIILNRFEENEYTDLSNANKEIKNLKIKINELIKIKNEYKVIKQDNINLKNENNQLITEIENLKKNNNNNNNNLNSEEKENKKIIKVIPSRNKILNNKFNSNSINPESLLLLKKIQDENKEIVNQLNYFRNKNKELENEILLIKKINNNSSLTTETLSSNYSLYINRSSSTKNEKKNYNHSNMKKFNLSSSYKNIVKKELKK